MEPESTATLAKICLIKRMCQNALANYGPNFSYSSTIPCLVAYVQFYGKLTSEYYLQDTDSEEC